MTSAGASELPVATGLLSPEAKDFVAGFVGGAAGVVAGQPLDTLRIRLQQPEHAHGSTARVWRAMAVREGWRALFKGMSYPLLTSGVQNAITFCAYGMAARALSPRSESPEQQAELGMGATFLAGSFSGLAQCPLMIPIDVLKIRAQLQRHMPGSAAYRGPSALLLHILRSEGAAGLYRGATVTVIRDTPSYGVYFCTYAAAGPAFEEALFRGRADPQGLHPASQFLAGGLAGITSWLSVYPFDVIKSRMQALPRGQSPYRSWLHCAALSWQREGPACFLRGLTPTLTRAFLVNASIFVAYEALLTAL